MINESMSIMRDGKQDYLPIPLPGSEGLSLDQAAQVDVESLVEIIPPAA
jgi:hypothetical protein